MAEESTKILEPGVDSMLPIVSEWKVCSVGAFRLVPIISTHLKVTGDKADAPS